MGVNRLWEILEPCKCRLPLEHLAGKRLSVDLSFWVIQLHQANHGSIRQKPHLRGLFHRIRALLGLNCRLVFVIDGDVPSIKLATYRRRLAGLSVQSGDLPQEVTGPRRRNQGSEFGRLIQEAKDLAHAFGIPCVTSLEEAESQCALLDSAGICDGCFTADSDAFLFGAQTIYKEFFLSDGGYVISYTMERIKDKLNLGRNSLIGLALLLGGDYSSGMRGIGCEKALKIVRDVGDDKILQFLLFDGHSNSLCHSKDLATAYRHYKLVKANKENQSLESTTCKPLCEVMDAYLNPKRHSLSSAMVQRVLVDGPVDLQNLKKICSVAFDWSSEKVEEYVLPKIAERDLRRTIQSESPASEDVQYRMLEILKVRVHRGIQHFEVSWVGKPDLQSSIVHMDIVQRAYPEKVKEFMSKRALKKKTKKVAGDSKAGKETYESSQQKDATIGLVEMVREFGGFSLQTDGIMESPFHSPSPGWENGASSYCNPMKADEGQEMSKIPSSSPDFLKKTKQKLEVKIKKVNFGSKYRKHHTIGTQGSSFNKSSAGKSDVLMRHYDSRTCLMYEEEAFKHCGGFLINGNKDNTEADNLMPCCFESQRRSKHNRLDTNEYASFPLVDRLQVDDNVCSLITDGKSDSYLGEPEGHLSSPNPSAFDAIQTPELSPDWTTDSGSLFMHGMMESISNIDDVVDYMDSYCKDRPELIDLTTPLPSRFCRKGTDGVVHEQKICSSLQAENVLSENLRWHSSPLSQSRSSIEDLDHQSRAEELRMFLRSIKTDLYR